MINGIIQAFSLVTSVGLSFIVNRFTRRSLWLTSTIGIFVCFIAWTICESLYEIHGNAAAGRTVLGLIFIYNFFFNIGWTPLQVVCEWLLTKVIRTNAVSTNVATDCIEILPIAIRARGLAIYNLSVSLAGFLNQYLNPVGLANIGWKCEWRCGHASTSEHPTTHHHVASGHRSPIPVPLAAHCYRLRLILVQTTSSTTFGSPLSSLSFISSFRRLHTRLSRRRRHCSTARRSSRISR